MFKKLRIPAILILALLASSLAFAQSANLVYTVNASGTPKPVSTANPMPAAVYGKNTGATVGPMTGYMHANVAATRLNVTPANTVTVTGALTAGLYDCVASQKMFCAAGLAGVTPTTATANYLPGDPVLWPVLIDGTTEDRIACLTTSGTGFLQCSPRSF